MIRFLAAFAKAFGNNPLASIRTMVAAMPSALVVPAVAVAAGVGGTSMLSASVVSSNSAFVASINNSANTAASGVLYMREQNSGATVTCLSTDGGTISTNSSTCSTINKFGGSTTMVPGTTVSTLVNITNMGTVSANTFTLTPAATCTQSNNGTPNGSATDICAKMNVVITSGATTVFTGTLATLAGHAAFTLGTPVVAGSTVPFTFAVTLDSTAGNTYQGLAASLPLSWSFTS
jgi:hypothetical protein